MVNASFGALVRIATISLAHLGLTESQESWFASMDYFCAIIFTPLGGLISDWIGRKKLILIVSPFAALGWLILGLSESTLSVFAGRIITSVAITFIYSVPCKVIVKVLNLVI